MSMPCSEASGMDQRLHLMAQRLGIGEQVRSRGEKGSQSAYGKDISVFLLVFPTVRREVGDLGVYRPVQACRGRLVTKGYI